MHGAEGVFQHAFQRGEIRHVGGASQKILERPRRLIGYKGLVEAEPQALGQRVIERGGWNQNLRIGERNYFRLEQLVECADAGLIDYFRMLMSTHHSQELPDEFDID